MRSIGRYEIVGVIGESEFGNVYSGLDPDSKGRVAIKTLVKSELDEASAPELSLMLRREARAGELLTHPNIVKVLDSGDEGDIAYVVSEFAEGRDLGDFFSKDERFEAGDAVAIMDGICAALHCAHEAGIVHRDLTPGNVIIDADGRARLTGFGLARFASGRDAEELAEEPGTILGTPACMAPETYYGEEIDGRVDIFAAGAILYRLLTGARPFAGHDSLEIARKILRENPPPPSTVNPAVPAEFDAVVEKALAKKAADRYRTSLELAAALRAAMDKSTPVAQSGRGAERAAAYHHILIHKEGNATELSLLFKDLSSDELETPFLKRFLQDAQSGAEASGAPPTSLHARVIRTPRTHDEEVRDYLRAWGERAEEFMRASGYPVNSQPMGDSAIIGAGEDVTAELLQTHRDEPPAEGIEDAREQYARWEWNRIPVGELARLLATVDDPPGFRSKPQAHDRRDRRYDGWFDGGAIVMPTGGANEYWFDDGVRVSVQALAARLSATVEWPDARKVRVEQVSDRKSVQPASSHAGRDSKPDSHDSKPDSRDMLWYRSSDPILPDRYTSRTLSKRALHDPEVRRKFRAFRREVCAARRVRHPNIVRVLQSGEDGDVIFIGAELIDGKSLASYLDAGKTFEVGTAVILMGELCAALDAAHEAGIVHCDVTPANVLIDEEGSVKLGEFGLARFDGPEAIENEPLEPGTLVGTPGYMSPEAIACGDIDRRADVFSAGVILYQMLTGQRPFAAPGPWISAKRTLEEDPPPPSSIDGTIPAAFDEVVRRALAKNPEDRYQSARELDVGLQGAMWKAGPGRLKTQ